MEGCEVLYQLAVATVGMTGKKRGRNGLGRVCSRVNGGRTGRVEARFKYSSLLLLWRRHSFAPIWKQRERKLAKVIQWTSWLNGDSNFGIFKLVAITIVTHRPSEWKFCIYLEVPSENVAVVLLSIIRIDLSMCSSTCMQKSHNTCASWQTEFAEYFPLPLFYWL